MYLFFVLFYSRLRRLLRQLGKSGRKRPFLRKAVPVLPLPVGDEDSLNADETSFEGSYVAVSGRPGSRTVHVVNGRGGVNIAGTGRYNLRILLIEYLDAYPISCE